MVGGHGEEGEEGFIEGRGGFQGKPYERRKGGGIEEKRVHPRTHNFITKKTILQSGAPSYPLYTRVRAFSVIGPADQNPPIREIRAT